MSEKKYNVLDLFCGCGGLSLGFEEAGYNIVRPCVLICQHSVVRM